MKKLVLLILGMGLSKLSFAFNSSDGTIAWELLKWVKPADAAIQVSSGKEGLTNLFIYVKDTIFGLLALIVIATFLYIGYKIIISKGNPEEFKKAFMMLIYAVMWLLVVSLAWVIVMFISGLNL